MRFYVGLHHPCAAARVNAPAFISINTLRKRKSDFAVGDWILDSGAFSTISRHGGYPHSPQHYGAQIKRWSTNGNLLAAVAQDYMCEPWMLERTGLTIADHQQMTIDRYDALLKCDVGGTYIMPVLQGYAPDEYLRHINAYGTRLAPGAWVGVGSVCKRNRSPAAIANVLFAIASRRPDLRLHGFGVKKTSLRSPLVRSLLHSADSMAWSYAARRAYRNPNDWREAAAFAYDINEVLAQPNEFWQMPFLL